MEEKKKFPVWVVILIIVGILIFIVGKYLLPTLIVLDTVSDAKMSAEKATINNIISSLEINEAFATGDMVPESIVSVVENGKIYCDGANECKELLKKVSAMESSALQKINVSYNGKSIDKGCVVTIGGNVYKVSIGNVEYAPDATCE